MTDSSDPRALSLQLRLHGVDTATSACEIDGSLERFGCAVLIEHGIDGELIRSSLAEARHLMIGGNGGSQASARHIVRTNGVVDNEQAGIGRDGAASIEEPRAYDTSSSVINRLTDALQDAGDRLLSLIATFLWLDKDWFKDVTNSSEASFRILEVKNGEATESSGAELEIGRTSDVISILLCGDDVSLQVRDRVGEWQPISRPIGGMMAMVGIMLERLTNDILPATRYRIATGGASACVLQYRVSFTPDFMIRTLPECVSAESWPDQYPEPARAGSLGERERNGQ